MQEMKVNLGMYSIRDESTCYFTICTTGMNNCFFNWKIMVGELDYCSIGTKDEGREEHFKVHRSN